MWFKLVWILKLQQMSTGSWKKTSAYIGAIYSLGVSIVPGVETFKQRGQEIFQERTTFENQCQKILNGHYFTKTRSMTMWASTVQNLKSKDVDMTSLGLQIDRLVQNNMCPFFKGDIQILRLINDRGSCIQFERAFMITRTPLPSISQWRPGIVLGDVGVFAGKTTSWESQVGLHSKRAKKVLPARQWTIWSAQTYQEMAQSQGGVAVYTPLQSVAINHQTLGFRMFVCGFFTHMETSTMPVNGFKYFLPMLGTHGHWALRVL